MRRMAVNILIRSARSVVTVSIASLMELICEIPVIAKLIINVIINDKPAAIT